jgi:hypothetical protein
MVKLEVQRLTRSKIRFVQASPHLSDRALLKRAVHGCVIQMHPQLSRSGVSRSVSKISPH